MHKGYWIWLIPLRGGITSGVCALGAIFMFVSMEKRFRATFYKHCTMAMHARDFWWDVATALRATDGDGAWMANCER